MGILDRIRNAGRPPRLMEIAPTIIEHQPVGLRSSNALTAAVSSVTLDGAAWKNYKFGDRNWQADAWRLYDITGLLRFVANWVGSSISKARLYVAEVELSGDVGKETTDPNIAVLAAGPLGVGPARAEMLRLLGVNLYVPGEAYVVAESGGAPDGGDLWWAVASGEIIRRGDRIEIQRPDQLGGGKLEFRDGTDLLIRCWTPHPHNSREPDSPTRSAIPDLRELEALRKREFAELDSRLAGAGLLAIPDGIDLPRGDDDPAGAAGFQAMLTRAMAASLRDRSTAEAMVPITITGNAPDLKEIRHITFWSDMSDQILPLWDKAVTNLARSLDIPPEVLLGAGQSNHWCTVRDVEIMTRGGWKTYDQLVLGEDVLTLNHITGLSEWQPLLTVNTWDVIDQPMIRIDGRSHRSITTPNHRWPVIVGHRSARRGRVWTTSAEIAIDAERLGPDAQRYDYLITGAPHADLPTELKYSDALVELVAWYFTEGDHGVRSGRNTPKTIITQSTTVNPDNCIRIERALTALFGPPSKFDKGGRYATMETVRRSMEAKQLHAKSPKMTAVEIGRRLGVSSTMVAKYLTTEPKLRDATPRWRVRQDSNNDSINRYLLNNAAGEILHQHAPGRVVRLDFIHALTAAQLELFIDTAVRADGWKIGDVTPVLDQKDPARLDAFELAVILSGRNAYRRVRNGIGRSAAGPVLKTSEMVSANTTTTFAPRGHSITNEMYTGVIWCPTTPNGTWLARHQGTTFYTGNSAWAISEDAIKTQMMPLLDRIAAAFTAGYLVPALKAMGVDTSKYVYAFDVAALTVQPNRAADAAAGYDRQLLSGDAVRQAGAWSDADKPTTQEIAQRIAVQVLERDPATALSDPDIRALLPLPAAPTRSPADTSTPAPPGPSNTPPEPATPNQPPAGPPPSTKPNTTPPAGPPRPAAAAAVEVAARFAMRRALSLAGQRLIPHSRRDQYRDTPRWQLNHHHGPVDPGDTDRLLAGAFADLDPNVLARFGINHDALLPHLQHMAAVILQTGMSYDDGMLDDLLHAPNVWQVRP